MTDDIAIIGASGIFPGAEDLESFHANLQKGRNSVVRPSDDRVRNGGGELDDEYLLMGYLHRVDLFDHEFFGIPRREAERMDPHQRLLLQLTHRAIESAGYAPAALRGSAAGVFLAGGMWFGPMDTERDVLSLLGSSGASLAARLSYLFDLRGPALVVDSACSSGLAALDLAVGMLRAGSLPFAVVGGVTLIPGMQRRADFNPLPGLESRDQVCRPFDVDADGLSGGEGGGVLVVKLLSRAVADGDNVFAVVKGIAVNHNGFRAASMAAPSQVAQASVITQAWRDGGVDPTTVGYVECHGSGTQLGDVVEVDALRRAFIEAGVTERHCPIGSVKANIGHLGNAAGIAGLFKVIAALRYGTRYPMINFREPNPLIDFTGPVYPNVVEEPWVVPDGVPRRAGVSSLGLTGTNAHVVLEEAVPVREDPDAGATAELVTVSARSQRALERYCARLLDFAEHTGHSIRSVAHVLNRGRDDHPYRLAFTAATTAELACALRSADPPERSAPDSPRLVLLFSGDALVDDVVWSRLRADCPGLIPVECEQNAGSDPASALVARQYALYRVAEALGLLTGADVSLVGTGAGNLVTRVARGRLSLADAAADAAARGISAEFDRDGLRRVVAGFSRTDTIAVEMGAGGVLAREIRELAPELPIVDLAGDGSRRSLLDHVGELYTRGAAIDWDRYYRDAAIARVELPTYPFEPTPCWPTSRPTMRRPDMPAAPAPREVPTDRPDRAEIERRVAEVWAEQLDITGLGPDSDYFMLGGTSLVGVGVLRALGERFGVPVTFADLYACRTVSALAVRLGELLGERAAGTGDGAETEQAITRVPRDGRPALSFGQETLWYLDQVNPDSALYNIPGPMHLTGKVDVAALQDALADVARRHEVLHSCFRTDEDGTPYVVTVAPEPLLPLVDVSRLGDDHRDRRVRALIHETVVAPFDLAEDALFRATLIKRAEDDHVLVLVFHHIVFDGWSPTVFMRDLAEFYRARTEDVPARLPELTVQYLDFAAWHRARLTGPRLRRGLEFWRSELAGLNREELPLDHPRPAVQSYAGDGLTLVIEAELADRVREFSRRNGVTAFVTMLAVLDVLIYRWTRQGDVCIGVATSGRIHPTANDLVGYFNNVLPFRTQVTADLRFDELVQRCAGTVAGVLDHEEVPLGKILSAGDFERDLARHPLFDVSYTYQNVLPYTGGLGELGFSRYAGTDIGYVAPGTAKFDLSFGISDDGTGPMIGDVGYATALFDRATAERLAAWYPALVAAAMTDPGTAIGDIAGPDLVRAGGGPGATVAGPAPAPPVEALAGEAPPAEALAGEAPPAETPPAETSPGEALAGSRPRTENPTPTGVRTDAAEVMCALFADLLGRERVGADEGFFALGGDSIKSIQLVARARRAGLLITRQQVFTHRTPAALAGVAQRPGTDAPVVPENDAGPIPLTPAMREFAERAGMPAVFAHSALVATPAGLDLDALGAAVLALVNRHEMLRSRLLRADEHDPASWSLQVAEPSAPAIDSVRAWVRGVDAAGLSPDALADAVAAHGRAAAGRLDPRDGVTAQLVWLDRGPDVEGRLVVVVHGLVVDLLSWRVLLPDLAAAYTAVRDGDPPAPPRIEASFGRWARALARRSTDPDLVAELPDWERILAPGEPPPGGRPLDPRRDTTSTLRRVTAALPYGVSGELLTRVPDAFHAETGDVLLIALAAAAAEWRATRGDGAGPVLVDVERHGREPLAGDVDTSGTVGWFAATHPVRLEFGDADFADIRAGGPTAGRMVKRAREQLAAVPGNGLGYGLLRHLAPDAGRRLAGLPTPSIGLRYAGAIIGDGVDPWRLLDLGGELAGTVPVAHAIEAVGVVRDTLGGAQLHLSLSAPEHLLAEGPLGELCEGWAAMLVGLAGHATDPTAGGHVPSDFPLVELSQDELDQIEAGGGR
ncbi:condensation domain-containing protein [Plantactinospora solaniradicis]|uniref:Condensation domain-containing protein n=1 Tax=Plantactinospora solaniradicis TaxID=1723736 RepID=A0ABW1KKB0_9ACTN